MQDAALEQVLNRAADAAAAAILPHFRTNFRVDDKGDETWFDPVTEADREAEKAIRAVIAEAFPDDGILGEEFGEQAGTSGRRWIIDPIDGTRSFLCGLPLFGTIVGLASEDRVHAGLFAQPFTGERFVAANGQAWFSHGGKRQPLRTRTTTQLTDALLMTTSPALFAPDELTRYQTIEQRARLARYGTDAYAYAMLAAGQIDLIVESGLQVYDIAGLIPLIDSAGGIVSTWDGGNPLQGGRIIAAATPALHEAALALINR